MSRGIIILTVHRLETNFCWEYPNAFTSDTGCKCKFCDAAPVAIAEYHNGENPSYYCKEHYSIEKLRLALEGFEFSFFPSIQNMSAS